MKRGRSAQTASAVAFTAICAITSREHLVVGEMDQGPWPGLFSLGAGSEFLLWLHAFENFSASQDCILNRAKTSIKQKSPALLFNLRLPRSVGCGLGTRVTPV